MFLIFKHPADKQRQIPSKHTSLGADAGVEIRDTEPCRSTGKCFWADLEN